MQTFCSGTRSCSLRSLLCAGASPTAQLGGIGQHEHVQTAEQEQEERDQRRVDHPEGRFPQSPGDEIGDDGHRKSNGQPAVDLPNPYVHIQWDLLMIMRRSGSGELCWQSSICPRQDLLQVRKELLPPELGALVGLLLIRPEARLLHAQVGPRARRCESPSDDTLETIGTPRVRQRFVRLDCLDLTVDSAPVCAKIETVVHDWPEIVLHEPLLDQVWLRERAPDLFRRKRDLPFDNDGERFGHSIAHWSILLSRSSSWSNRLCQKPAIWLLQSIRGAKAPSCAL